MDQIGSISHIRFTSGFRGIHPANRVPLSSALQHPHTLSHALLRLDSLDGSAHVPVEPGIVARHRGNHNLFVGNHGVCDVQRGGVNQQERLLETVFSGLDAIRNAERTLPSCLKNIC